MATTLYPTQYGEPSEFMKYLQEVLSEALSLDPSVVQVSTDETGDQKPHSLGGGDRAIRLVLNDPRPVNPNAGAGRHATPLARQLVVKIRTRGGLDQAGEDKVALLAHWNFQDQVMDALLFKANVVTGEDAVPGTRFVLPVKFVGNGGTVKRVKDSGGAYESVFVFELTYVPKVVRNP
jgi:hypothetical protein